MEQNFYTDDFEQLLKEKSDQFRMYPSKRVWHSIYNNLHPGRRWPSVAMSMLLIIVLMLIGYLNTSDNTVTNHFTANSNSQNSNLTDKFNNKENTQQPSSINPKNGQLTNLGSAVLTEAGIEPGSDNTAVNLVNYKEADVNSVSEPDQKIQNKSNNKSVVETIDNYIKYNQIFADISTSIKKESLKGVDQPAGKKVQEDLSDDHSLDINPNPITVITDITLPKTSGLTVSEINIPAGGIERTVDKNNLPDADTRSLSPEEKSWIENYAMYNTAPRNKWKDRVNVAFYVTPAVNYRKLSTNTKGSSTPFANSDINHSISQKPGIGLEAGIGLEYAIAKNLRIKAGAQFNYTNYNINADQTNHPILTSILLTDTYTGYSYLSSRSSTISNNYNSSAHQPVVLHNRTYQISIPVGFAYRMSGNKNVEWFAGASFQPTYVFGGNAHLISSDLKNYVYDPSSIRNWNLNLGFETYMNYKLGSYNLQVGPQVRYQVYSTYNKNIALIEKPYAIGFKMGIVKGF